MQKSFIAIGTVAMVALAGFAYATARDHTGTFSSEQVKESYSIGSMIGQQLEQEVTGVDVDAFLSGLRDGFSGQSKLGREEISAVLQNRQEREQEAALAQARELAAQNEAEGSAFRAEFAKRGEVVTLDNGLQYKVLVPGEGEAAGPGGVATVHYRGSFVDGTEFDSSYGGEPVQVEIDRTIPGWSEALKRMAPGAKWQLVIPPHLAYGDEGAGRLIEPGSTLVFEIELMEVS